MAERSTTPGAPHLKLVRINDLMRHQTRALLHGLADLSDQADIVGAVVVYQLKTGEEMMATVGTYQRPGATSRAGFLLQMDDARGDRA